MREVVTVTGMVLKASTVKEYDKRIELLTKERGRISAFAQGARRPNNLLSACTIPFTFGTYRLYEGRDSYNIQSAEIREYFQEIAEDFDVMCMASYFAEMEQFFTRENVEASQELSLLYITLKALIKNQVARDLIRVVFEMRLMQLQGEGLELFHCLQCGREDKLCQVYLSRGGFLCRDCISKIPEDRRPRGITLSHDGLYTLQFIITSPLEKLYSFRVSPEIQNELTAFMKLYLEHYLHHDFKSLTFLTL